MCSAVFATHRVAIATMFTNVYLQAGKEAASAKQAVKKQPDKLGKNTSESIQSCSGGSSPKQCKLNDVEQACSSNDPRSSQVHHPITV